MKEDRHNYNDDAELLTHEDIEFIQRSLCDELVSADDLSFVMRDESIRQQVMSSRTLFDALGNENEALRVSEYFYYYVLARQVMLEAGLDDPVFTENTAHALVEMARRQRKLLGRGNASAPSHFPVVINALTRDEAEGMRVTVHARLSQFRMDMEGYLYRVGKGGQQD